MATANSLESEKIRHLSSKSGSKKRTCLGTAIFLRGRDKVTGRPEFGLRKFYSEETSDPNVAERMSKLLDMSVEFTEIVLAALAEAMENA